MSKKKGNGYGSGTFIETSMIVSKAFMSLGVKGSSPTVSSGSIKILLMLLAKRQFSSIKDHKTGHKKLQRTDNNEFHLTYAELETRGIPQKIATRGIDELLAKGFIDIVDPGGAFEKHKAVYSLSNDFLLWQPGKILKKRVRDVLRGYQKRQNKLNTADVNDGHPHRRQRGTPPIKDTDVNGTHLHVKKNRVKSYEKAC